VRRGFVAAADAGVGYYWQGAGLGYARPSNLAQDRVELVTAVAVQVQGKVKRPDQVVFKLPPTARVYVSDVGSHCVAQAASSPARWFDTQRGRRELAADSRVPLRR